MYSRIMRLTAIVWLLTCSITLHAQITLSASDYTITPPQSDSVRLTKRSSPLPPFPMAADTTWDLTMLLDSNATFFRYRLPDTLATFADSQSANFLSFVFPLKGVFRHNSGALARIGDRTSAAAFNTTAITSGAYDSLFFLDQIALYNAPDTVLAFPATYGSAWQSKWVRDLPFEVSVEFFAYVHAPCFRRTYWVSTDSITGWGRLKMRDAAGDVSPAIPVLQKSRTITTIDSFFLNGLPMPASLLTTYGLTQGYSDTQWHQLYYRTGEVTPLAEVRFADAGFSRPQRVYSHPQRLGKVGIGELPVAKPIAVVPNPVANGHLIINGLPTGNYQALITDLSGRICLSGQLGAGCLQLPEGLPAGTYQLVVTSAAQVLHRQLITVSR